LKRSDFQKGVIDTVTSADQIIVLDSDGSIEPQIIDFAKVVTSNPFTGAFWPNSSTALTGADLANSDRIPVLDGSVPKYIEADQLAQGSQFSSRFVARSQDSYLWIGAGDLDAVDGSPSTAPVITVGYRAATAWFFDASVLEMVAASTVIPSHWATYNISLWWCNSGTTAGNVVWGAGVRYGASTVVPDDAENVSWYPAATAAPTTKGEITILTSSTYNNTSAGNVTFVRVFRLGGDANDTLTTADACLYGVMLTRMS
jgi:hypothetical protein